MTTAVSTASPIVIAHRGASGYLPEHTPEAKALAHAMGADYLEQDVVLTADGIPIVLHDIYLESTTDVEQKYPGRARADGRYYALDFKLEEIRQLRAHERSRRGSQGQEVAVYPQRFPLNQGDFRVPTLADEIALIAGLDRSRGRRTGLYLELKAPRWHASQGYDLASAIMQVLEDSGYAGRAGQVYLQCFDDATLIRLRDEFKSPLPLIQLIGENDWGEDTAADYDAMRTPEGLDRIARYASGIGPWIPHVVEAQADGSFIATGLTRQAQLRGLQVHPYTLRREELPTNAKHLDELHRALFESAGVDGAFTDFPDLTRRYLDSRTRTS